MYIRDCHLHERSRTAKADPLHAVETRRVWYMDYRAPSQPELLTHTWMLHSRVCGAPWRRPSVHPRKTALIFLIYSASWHVLVCCYAIFRQIRSGSGGRSIHCRGPSNTMMGVPHFNYGIMGPNTPFQLLRPVTPSFRCHTRPEVYGAGAIVAAMMFGLWAAWRRFSRVFVWILEAFPLALLWARLSWALWPCTLKWGCIWAGIN